MNPIVREVQIGNCRLIQGDCREVLPLLGRVELVATDPPYGKVVKSSFDHDWTNRDAMLESVQEWLNAIVPRVQKNGTLYLFAWPSLAGKIEAMIAKDMNVLSHIVWKKEAPRAQKVSAESLRSPCPETERIIMAEHYGADLMAKGEGTYHEKCDELRGFVFEPLVAYLAGELARSCLTRADVDKAWREYKQSPKGGMSGHWFGRSQWELPTAENYNWLRGVLNRNGGEFLAREYEGLRLEYEGLRLEYEGLRRHFDLKTGDQKTDFWQFKIQQNDTGHPTQKPLCLMQFIVRISSRPGGTVLDPFMGSGTTGVACVNLGRSFIGIERDLGYFEIACRRITDAYAQGDFLRPEPAPVPVVQIDLLGGAL